MEIGEERRGAALVLSPQGRLDSTTAPEFEQRVRARMAEGNRDFVIDLGALDYVSSAGLRALVIASKSSNGRGLGLAAMQPVVREIYAIARFDAIIAAFETVRDALAKLDPGALDHLPGSA